MTRHPERYETVEHGIATSDGYCYACPAPIRAGQGWRRERVGDEVPHRFRLVHDTCPTSGEDVSAADTLHPAVEVGGSGLPDYRRTPDVRPSNLGPSNTRNVGDGNCNAGGVVAHLIALIAGLPVAGFMLLWVFGSLAFGDYPGMFPLLLGSSSTLGCVLAVLGMRARPRTHRVAALVLTVIPASIFVLLAGLLALFVLAMGNTN